MTVTFGPLAEVTCVRGESFTISAPTGDVTPGGDTGFYVRDTRFLDHLELRVNGTTPQPLSGESGPGDRAWFHAHLPPSRQDEPDGRILVVRRRIVDGGMHEEIELRNPSTRAEPAVLELRVGTDFAYIFDVRRQRALQRAAAGIDSSTVSFTRADGAERTTVEVTIDGHPAHPVAVPVPGGARLWLELHLPPGRSRTVCLDVTAEDAYGAAAPGTRCGGFEQAAAAHEPAIELPAVECSQPAFTQLVAASMRDLESLVLEDPGQPGSRFVAAGSPWFLTLFGRDSLWAGLMALPVDPGLAVGTLQTLARRQGTRTDPETEEEPGKILHEVRRGALADRGDLPPNYYGSVDATPLFVVLAHQAWRWGVPEEVLEPLLGNVERALEWLAAHGDADGDGLVEHRMPTGRGLVNQGWKDSTDGIRFADGTIARGPMALCEVQGYAWAAARGGAELLAHFDRGEPERWRDWAERLAARFRGAFWIDDPDGPYPAMALDGDKRPADAVASNMGHLLMTGMLTDQESAAIAQRLTRPDMASGFGLRTLSSETVGYNPLSYHCGSVWPHDTAITIAGLARSGHGKAAGQLLDQLLAAAPAFGYRLPELFAGLSDAEAPTAVPYPSACRPQAWAAGGALLILRAVLGLEADAPNGALRVRPVTPPPWDRLRVEGLRVGDRRLTVTAEGSRVEVGVDGAPLEVVTD